MRDILFRAKTVDNNEWVCGYYANCHNDSLENNTTGNFIIEYPDKYHEIYTDTIGQYAGRCDKNGKRIFEGDIVKTNYFGKDYGEGRNFDEYDTYVVEWVDSGFCMKNKTGIYGLFKDDESIEVIGNIYENKELLEGVK